MPITVEYGPIAGALSLAQQAGRGRGFASQSQRDLQALQLQNQMQGTINSNAANLIQLGLARDQMNANLQMKRQQDNQEDAYRQAQLQLVNQGQQFTHQAATTAEADRAAQAKTVAAEKAAQQATADKSAASLEELRKAQTNHLNNPPEKDQTPQIIRANGMALRSLDQEAGVTQRQIQTLTAALAKASDPYTGSPENATSLKQQIDGLKLTLDGVDPATGKKVQTGLNDKRNRLRELLQNGAHLKPGAVLKTSDIDPTQLDFENDPDNEGLDNPDDPLYSVNTGGFKNISTGPSGQAQPAGQAAPQQQQQRQATPALILQAAQQVSQQTGLPLSDPQVKAAVRNLLQQNGFTIPALNAF